MTKKILLTLLSASFVLSACGGDTTPDPALDPNLAMTAAFATVNAAFTQTALAVPTTPPTPTRDSRTDCRALSPPNSPLP